MELDREDFKRNKNKMLAAAIIFGIFCLVLSFVYSQAYAWILRGTGTIMLAFCLYLAFKNSRK